MNLGKSLKSVSRGFGRLFTKSQLQKTQHQSKQTLPQTNTPLKAVEVTNMVEKEKKTLNWADHEPPPKTTNKNGIGANADFPGGQVDGDACSSSSSELSSSSGHSGCFETRCKHAEMNQIQSHDLASLAYSDLPSLPDLPYLYSEVDLGTGFLSVSGDDPRFQCKLR